MESLKAAWGSVRRQPERKSAPGTRAFALIFAVIGAALALPMTQSSAASTPLVPVSVSFPTSNSGFALSLTDCATRVCGTLERTGDAGSSWTPVSIPTGMAKDLRLAKWKTYFTYYDYQSLYVHFADARNGWIYGIVPAPVTSNTQNSNFAAHLWSTHDGGVTWSPIRLAPLGIDYGVIQMASHGDLTYLYGASFRSGQAKVLSTPSSADRWTSATSVLLEVPAGGTQLQGSFTFSGNAGWFTAGNDRGVQSQLELTPGGRWVKWKTRSIALGGRFSPVVATSSRDLLTVTSTGGFVIPPANTVPAGWNRGASWLFLSSDGGESFRAARQLSQSFEVTYPSLEGLPQCPVRGDIILQRDSDTSGTSVEQLIMSTNSGRSWRVVLRHGVLQVTFASQSIGFAVAQLRVNPLESILMRTTNGGAIWTPISL